MNWVLWLWAMLFFVCFLGVALIWPLKGEKHWTETLGELHPEALYKEKLLRNKERKKNEMANHQ